MKRTRYQFGSVYLKERKRGVAVWVYRYFEDGLRKSVSIGSIEKYPTKADALKASESLRLVANPDKATAHVVRFGALIDRYIGEELPDRKSTRRNNLSWLENWVRPKWGAYPIDAVKPFAVETWLKGLKLAPKSKVHIRHVMSLLFKCAMRWELSPLEANPMSLVRVPDATKLLSQLPAAKLKQLGCKPRLRKVLSFEQIQAVLNELDEPFRTMAVVAACLGLRASEIAGLHWDDFNWEESFVFIQRGVVEGNVDDVKSYYSKSPLPLSPGLVEILKEHRARWEKKNVPWVFRSSQFDRPYSMYDVQGDVLDPAGERAGLGKGLGWHSFRHTYSTFLRVLKADVKVQQSLLRHADIGTTLNVYTHPVSEEMRKANNKVVEMMLRKKVVNA
jgi:integrase